VTVQSVFCPYLGSYDLRAKVRPRTGRQ
jgi:hypothetical protein